VGARPLFCCRREIIAPIQADIEARLAEAEPDVEVLLAEVLPGGTVRLFIDHPEGVTIGLCERVSSALSSVRATHALEVSSPGRERPLTKPGHFRRFVGSRARIRTTEPLRIAGGEPARSFTGELVGATDTEVTIAGPAGVLTIPYAAIKRSNLVGD
jgi:ribosome maturation factor RimP